MMRCSTNPFVSDLVLRAAHLLINARRYYTIGARCWFVTTSVSLYSTLTGTNSPKYYHCFYLFVPCFAMLSYLPKVIPSAIDYASHSLSNPTPLSNYSMSFIVFPIFALAQFTLLVFVSSHPPVLGGPRFSSNLYTHRVDLIPGPHL